MDGTTDEKETLNSNSNHEQTLPIDGGCDGLDNKKESAFVEIISFKEDKEVAPTGDEFVGLRKEELMQYANDPYWVKLRIILLVLFALLWVSMLVGAIVIIVVAPKCPPRPQQDWWEPAVIYHIRPESFLDTNDDGVGDLKGVHKKIDYLKDTLGVSAVCLGPIQPADHAQIDNNLVEHAAICGRYGTEEDFNDLRVALHKKGLKLILDFIPNHTSRKHRWFNASRQGMEEFKDYYIWHTVGSSPDGTRHPPNNWLSVRGGSAWEFDDARGQYYYHSFSKDEPDLNLRNPNVIKQLDEALMFWLKKKVDGFRFVGVKHLVESTEILKNETEHRSNGIAMKYENLDHELTAFQPESYALVNHWRELLDNYGLNDGKPKSQSYPRLLIADVSGTTEQVMTYTSFNDTPGANLPTNKILLDVNAGCKTECIYNLVDQWMKVEKSKSSNWQVGNVDVSRVATRIGNSSGFLNAIHMLLMTLPGTAFAYYGDELGMHDKPFSVVPINSSFTLDQLSRAGHMTPMQWSDHHNAGFTSGNKSPWLPVSDDYPEVNVEAQLAHGSGMSHIKVFAKLVKLRKEPSIQWGAFHHTKTRNIYYFVRQAEGFPGILVAINFGTQPSTVNFKEGPIADKISSDSGEVLASTYNFHGEGRSSTFADGTVINLGSVVYLKPGEGIVLQWQLDSSLF